MSNELYHFGIKGMKWGVRRYQNEDGSLTSAGQARYGTRKLTRADKRKILDDWEENGYSKKMQDSITAYKSADRKIAKKYGVAEAKRKYHEEAKKRAASKSFFYSKEEKKALKAYEKAANNAYKEQKRLYDSFVKDFENATIASYGKDLNKRGQKWLRRYSRWISDSVEMT